MVIGLISEDKDQTIIARLGRWRRGDSRSGSYEGWPVSKAGTLARSVTRNLLNRRDIGFGDAVMPTQLIIIPERPDKTQ
jgi:hypothetical protein